MDPQAIQAVIKILISVPIVPISATRNPVPLSSKLVCPIAFLLGCHVKNVGHKGFITLIGIHSSSP